MGKIRVSTLGDEKLEKKAAEAKSKKKEAKPKAPEVVDETTPKVKKSSYKEKVVGKISNKSPRHSQNKAMVEQNKLYTLSESLDLLLQMKRSKFDETVELHFNTANKGVSGSITLPHGTGKQTKVAIISSKDPATADRLIEEIANGNINFDILIATPDAMPRLAKVARILGPKGLMPNPKNGTVTAKPEEVAEKYAGGQTNFKAEAKLPLLHMSVGKLSFGKEKLMDNIKAAINAVENKNIKKATLKSTMSAGIKIQI